MKSKTLLLLLFCTLLGNACKPEILQSNGKATAIRNSSSWDAKSYGFFIEEGRKFSVRIFDIGIDKCPDKVLDFLNIPAEPGKVDLFSSSSFPSGGYAISYASDHEQCDVVTIIYDLDESAATNFLEITSIKGRRVEGIFDLQFINLKDSTETLRIKDGVFSSRLEKED